MAKRYEMHCSVRYDALFGAAAVVDPGLVLDFRDARSFKDCCKAYSQAGLRHFVVDFSRTALIDSEGLGSLLAVYRTAIADGGCVMLVAPCDFVAFILTHTRVARLFSVFDNVDEALAHIPAALQERVEADTATAEPRKHATGSA